jgi:hypothetical protein
LDEERNDETTEDETVQDLDVSEEQTDDVTGGAMSARRQRKKSLE